MSKEAFLQFCSVYNIVQNSHNDKSCESEPCQTIWMDKLFLLLPVGPVGISKWAENPAW